MQLWLDWSEKIGCYLPLMELYDKLFVIFWLWQMICVASLLITIVYDVLDRPCCHDLLPFRPPAPILVATVLHQYSPRCQNLDHLKCFYIIKIEIFIFGHFAGGTKIARRYEEAG